jgi:hypothetical protein
MFYITFSVSHRLTPFPQRGKGIFTQMQRRDKNSPPKEENYKPLTMNKLITKNYKK